MHIVRLGLIWAAIILTFAVAARMLGLEQQTSSIFVSGLSVLAVLHIGSNNSQSKSCGQ